MVYFPRKTPHDATKKELKVSLRIKLSHGDKPPDATKKELKVYEPDPVVGRRLRHALMQLRKN